MLDLPGMLMSHADVLAKIPRQPLMQNRRPTERPLGLAGPPAHQVRGLGMMPLELPPLGHLKTAENRLVGLQFIRHRLDPLRCATKSKAGHDSSRGGVRLARHDFISSSYF